MAKPATVLESGYCHASDWKTPSVFVYDLVSDSWRQYAVKDSSNYKDLPQKARPVAEW